MKKSLTNFRINLFTKLLLTYMVVISLFIIVLLFLGSFLYHNFFARFYHNIQITNCAEIASSLSEENLFEKPKQDTQSDIQDKINSYAKLVDANIWVFNTDGQVIVESVGGVRTRFLRKSGSSKESLLKLPERSDIELLIKEKELLGENDPLVYQDDENYGKKVVLFTYAPIFQAGQDVSSDIVGGVILFSPFPPAKALVRIDPRFLSLAALTAFAAAVLLGYYLSRKITKPLKEMSKAAVNMTAGNFSILIPAKTGDEVEELAHSFNYLARELENKITELSREKERISTIIANMAEGIIGINKRGEIVYYNPQALEFLNLSNREGTSQTQKRINKIILPNSLERLSKDVLADNQQRELVLTVDAEVNSTNINRSRILSIRVEPLSNQKQINNNGNVAGKKELLPGNYSNDLDFGCLMVIYDITERWKYEQMQKEFVANVSHELRTPLALIQGYIEAFIDDYVEDPSKSLKIIHNETIRLKKIVNDLLSLAAIDRDDEAKEPVSLNTLVRNIIFLAESQAKKEGLEIIWLVEDDPMNVNIKVETLEIEHYTTDFMVLGNYDRLQQIVINLVDNAIRYSVGGSSEPNGRIYVSIGREKIMNTDQEKKTYCFIRVRDEGIGIPQNDLPYIWNRFYRVDKSGNRAKGGSGLGLAIVKHIVEHYGGFVTVDSKEGEGSVFTVYLPAI